jgi:hypothetical protein
MLDMARFKQNRIRKERAKRAKKKKVIKKEERKREKINECSTIQTCNMDSWSRFVLKITLVVESGFSTVRSSNSKISVC